MDYGPDLHRKVEAALREFFLNEPDLLKRDVNERSITHKLAEHLQHQFECLKVDCEYNRHQERRKTLLLPPEEIQTDCLDAKTVYPDIVIHRRGDDGCNRLVIEVKKSSRPGVSRDRKKLCAFTKLEYGYNYNMGLLLVFDVRKNCLRSAECFRQGKKSDCAFCESFKGFCGQ